MEYRISSRGLWVMIFSFLGALVLSILPLSTWATAISPPWILLVLIYWIVFLPQSVGLLTAWCLGFLLDALYGSVLGEHALALTIVAYIVGKIYRQIRVFPLFQQMMVVFFMVVFYELVLLCVDGMLGQFEGSQWFWVAAVTSFFCWPFISTGLRFYRKHFRLY